MLKVITIILSLTLSININTTSLKMFDEELLNNPVQNKKQLEEIFNYHEIGIFNGRSYTNTIILENGYAKSKILNKQDWEKDIKNKKVTQIDIIFTKYPFKKEDWITNYHKLLSARLKELFALDPSLNSSKIEWNLVLQTNCKTENQAKQFFHGILIKYQTIEEPDIVSPKDTEVKKRVELKTLVDTLTTNNNSVPIEENFVPDYSNTRVFKKKRKKPKTKRAPLPECATFK